MPIKLYNAATMRIEGADQPRQCLLEYISQIYCTSNKHLILVLNMNSQSGHD